MSPRFDTTELRQFAKHASDIAKNFPAHVKDYLASLFPIAKWIRRYNPTWFYGDVIAGLTVGLLILPQGLAQAKIATLPPEYGLYTAFVGLCVYAFFATSKDATIGPTAVLSLLVSQLLVSANTDANGNDIYPKTMFAITLAFMTGIYQLAIGFLRIGFIANFIPSTVIQGFTTGAAISIIIQQTPSLLGISKIETNRQPIYLAFRDILLNLYRTQLDAALGLTAVAVLVTLKILKETVGTRVKWVYWVGIARNGIVLVLYLLISYAITTSNGNKAPFQIVGTIPPGFKAPQKPNLDADILGRVWIPAFTSTLISAVEHVGIVKAFGKKFGYTRNINPNQEIIAVGVSNFIGSFMSGYPATGSFSRSAVLAASGVRTPLAGLITAVIVITGLYGLTGVFKYIPNSVLAAIIIAAISELISSYDTFVEFWNIGFFDFIVFITAIIATIFGGVEFGIYLSVALAAFIVLMRLARPKVLPLIKTESGKYDVPETDGVPLVANGIMVIRFSESIEYPNSMYVGSRLLELVTENTGYGGKPRKAAERLWFDDTEERALMKGKGRATSTTITSNYTAISDHLEKSKTELTYPPQQDTSDHQPILKAVVFDFSAVNVFDQAGFTVFRETREELARYAGRPVYFYFAFVKPQIRRNIIRLLSTPYNADTLTVLKSKYEERVIYQSLEIDDVFFISNRTAVAAALLGVEAVDSGLQIENGIVDATVIQVEDDARSNEGEGKKSVRLLIGESSA
ncbi:hypothetical protein HK098_002853 [Nowakowskiella sp. JEL0407]|nr:hypothetical protein HK098_002853 [Nowakowskiella sp. JEL0407]